MIDNLYDEVLALLKQLIAIPSPSKQESNAKNQITDFLESKGIRINSYLNNLWVIHPDYQKGRYTILLNSHLDTVNPSNTWTYNPFIPTEINGKLYGLGSNDAGASLVALIATFLYFNQRTRLPFNLIFAATAEEEISGYNGIESIIEFIGPVDLAIIGEPTKMQLAVAEKGLMVLDCKVTGHSGHAARNEGENAIYKALVDIEWFQNFSFDKDSDILGPVKMSVTQVNAGSQHNVVPDICTFVVDVRTNERYTNSEVVEIIRGDVSCEVKARSLRLGSSSIPNNHLLISIANEMNIHCFGSPTTSDQSVIPYTSVKIGPGDSARSHTANEYVEFTELRQGINIYKKILERLGNLL